MGSKALFQRSDSAVNNFARAGLVRRGLRFMLWSGWAWGLIFYIGNFPHRQVRERLQFRSPEAKLFRLLEIYKGHARRWHRSSVPKLSELAVQAEELLAVNPGFDAAIMKGGVRKLPELMSAGKEGTSTHDQVRSAQDLTT
jgi:hypothetical protein